MAKKKYGKRSEKETEDKPRAPESKKNEKLLKRILERSKVMIEADQENRSAAMADIRFVNEPGAQWNVNMKKEREGRPCLEANTLRINGKRIINEIRANRPQGHVRAVEGGDKQGAELREGLVRNILNISDFDSITDYAAEYQVDGGLGAWRVTTDYSDDTMFDQDILVEALKNPLSLYWDPACKDILQKRDAADWVLIDRIPIAEYEAKYGDAEKFDFSSDDELAIEEWEDEETVRVCEYWYKEPYDKELWLVELPKEDGSGVDRLTVDSTSDEAAALAKQGIKPIKTRLVHCHKVMMCVASGKSILEGPVEWGSPEFPFVVVHGEIKVIEGKVRWWGLHRHSKDAQQIQNVFWTAATETIALAPKAYDWATTTQAQGNLEQWAEAHAKNIPVKIYNADPLAPGAPARVPGAQVPAAMMEMVGLSGDLIRTTSGLHEASFGEESDEKSGIALARKQRQAQIVTYNFPDNMAKGAKRTGEIVLSLIPVIYDAERELRILGADGEEDYRTVNHVVFDPKTGTTTRVDDLTSGKYDYYVEAGPSWSSMLEESSEILGDLVQKFPEMMTVMGDLFFKSSSLPYSKEMAERMTHMLIPPVQKSLSEGKEIPPEAQAVLAQANQTMMMAQEQTKLVQAAAQEVQQDQQKSVKDKAAVDNAVAQLEVKRAQLEAYVAKVEAQFVKREADLNAKQTQLDAKETVVQGQQKATEGAAKQITSVEQVAQQLDQYLAQFMQSVHEAMTQIKAESGSTIVMPAKPRAKALRTRRENGELVGEVQYEDGGVQRYRSQRQPDGSLMAIAEDEKPTVQ